jgi:hypothetical protein
VTFDQQASNDFDRAMWKAFWRKVIALLTGTKNELLPFDEVRRRLPIRGQHYIGLKEVPIDQIIGSEGRYADFDRAFLPVQSRTKERWINIDKAQYQQIDLPAVDLYKMGEAYFVRDGNHRISVARQRGQSFVDAYVVEIDIPVPLSANTVVDDLALKEEYARFIDRTDLLRKHPEVRFETAFPGQYRKLLEHIDVHRWFLGEQRKKEVSYPDAVASWYDNLYYPVISTLREADLARSFPGLTETDLYLWIMDYQWMLRQNLVGSSREVESGTPELDAGIPSARIMPDSPEFPVRKLIKALKRDNLLESILLKQERASFIQKTRFTSLCPKTELDPTLPGGYERILDHISVHRWYLGEQRGAAVAYKEAVTSWCDNVYLPLIKVIQDQGILVKFPGRSETDLYLWIIEHLWFLKQEYGEEISIEQAAERYMDDFQKDNKKNEIGGALD